MKKMLTAGWEISGDCEWDCGSLSEEGMEADEDLDVDIDVPGDDVDDGEYDAKGEPASGAVPASVDVDVNMEERWGRTVWEGGGGAAGDSVGGGGRGSGGEVASLPSVSVLRMAGEGDVETC
jgi:hypothetical protein